MATFAYVALEPNGRKRTGTVDAADKQAAINAVTSGGQFVVEIAESGGQKVQKDEHRSERHRKATRADLALFTRRLADLAGAGLPLDRALAVLAEQSESAQLTHICRLALEDVRTGVPVSQALAKHPKLFPDVFTQTLRAGEASGQFAQSASRLAELQEKEVARRSQITSALVYPAVLTGVAVMVIIFLLTFVVPRLQTVFEGLGDDLPTATKILLGTAGFITNNWVLLIVVVVGGYFGLRAWFGTESGMLARDTMSLRLPGAGPIISKAIIGRYARVLGTLIYGGVPILDALRIAGLASGNKVTLARNAMVEEEVREGQPIAEAMRIAGGFPPVLTHMVAIGEETGDLPTMLSRVADSLDFEVETSLRRLTSLLEPVIVIAMGIFVGFVVLSVMLPIFQAQDLVK